MESCLQFIPRKSYNTFGYVVLALFSLTAFTLIGITSDLNTKSQLSCNPGKNVAVDFSQKAFVEATCTLKFDHTYNVPLPLYKFVILNFGLVFALCIVYAFAVKSRVEYWDEPTPTDDVELQPLSQIERSQPDQDNRNHGIPVYYIYISQLLFFRLVPMILFVALVLYPADFPTNFSCPWLIPGTSSIYGNITDNIIKKQLNFTTVHCKNPLGSTSTSLAKAVWIVDIIFSIVTLVEVAYLVWQNCKDNYFARDSVFCTVYLRGRKKSVRKIIENYKNKLASDKTVFKLDVLSLAKGTLDEMYVKLIIQTGREKLPQHSDRHEMYQAYLVPPQDSISVKKMEDLFFKEGKRSHKILVVGRPGIGKTVLTKKILHQWTTSKDKFWSEKRVILLRFRTFNEEQNKVTTLKNMFRLGVGLPTGSDFDDVYKFILSNPERVILIFDGLDELNVDCDNCWKIAEDTPDDYNQCMPVFSILEKLISGRFLPTITVLITSRPTANDIYDILTIESRFEILGFTKLEIQDYVKKFCQSDEKLNTRMWNLIEASPELLSLCYIPVSCYIICLTLKKCMEHEDSGFSIPRTMTELYQRAVRIILWDHNPTHKNKPKKRDYMKTSLPGDLKDTLDKLKTLAKTGIKERKLIFEIKADDDVFTVRNCGLFNSLENDESHHFSFIHLTIQEFLAAMEIVDESGSPEDVGWFLSTHIGDPNWHLVIQFFAGLLADKFREDKSSMEKMCESFVEQISSITSRQVVERKVSLLMIKCLYEMQECGITESAASKVDGGGERGCDLEGLDIAPVDCTGLFQFLSHVKNLEKIHLSRNNIGENGCLDLAKFLCRSNKVTELSVGGNSIKDEGVKHLCHALINVNCKLTGLDLSSNDIKDEGVKHLCDALINENCKLNNLDLRSNSIRDEGVKYLFYALIKENCKLTNLNLNSNRIKDEDVRHLCDALINENCKLTDLNLSFNRIKDEGVRHLCDALINVNCKLICLELSHNDIKDEGVKHLCDALINENCKLIYLALFGNSITDKRMVFLRQAANIHNVMLAFEPILNEPSDG